MQKKYRNILAFVLLLAIMLPINFAFLSYRFQLKMIKRQVKQQLIETLDDEQLVRFQFEEGSLDFQSLEWKDGHEFEYRGRMFDIVQADTVGTTIHFLCFPDKQETALNHLFDQHLKDAYSQNKGVKNRANHFLSLLSTLYFATDSCKDYPKFIHGEARFVRDSTYFNSVYLDVIFPPPEVFHGWNS